MRVDRASSTRAIQAHSLPSSSLKVLRANRYNLLKHVDSSFRMIPPSKSNLSQQVVTVTLNSLESFLFVTVVLCC